LPRRAIRYSRDRDEKVEKKRPKGRTQDPGHANASLRPKYRRVDDLGQDGVEGRCRQSMSTQVAPIHHPSQARAPTGCTHWRLTIWVLPCPRRRTRQRCHRRPCRRSTCSASKAWIRFSRGWSGQWTAWSGNL